MKSPEYVEISMLDNLLAMVKYNQNPQEFTRSSNENVRKIKFIFSPLCLSLYVCVCLCMGICVI